MKSTERMTVAVTGATGFVGTHVCLELANRGFQVKACVRSFKSKKCDFLRAIAQQERYATLFSFHETDLLIKGSYTDAFTGCDAVIHTATVAQSFATNSTNLYEDYVRPSVEGTRNVLECCSNGPPARTVRRIVYTGTHNSCYDMDRPPHRWNEAFSEKDFNRWSTIERGDPYGYGKRLAEEMVLGWKSQGNPELEVVTILPSGIIGRCCTKAHSHASPVWIRNLLQGRPQLDFNIGWVDVKDVAKAHVNACLVDKERIHRRRILVTSSSRKLSDLASILQRLFPQFLAEFVGLPPKELDEIRKSNAFVEKCMQIPGYLKYDTTLSNKLLGIEYRPIEETLKETVESLIEVGAFEKYPALSRSSL